MGEMITIHLNNFLFNAGVVGFIYLLETNKVSEALYKIDGSELSLDSKLFLDEHWNFSQMYFTALQSRFKDDTSWNRLVQLEDEITRLNIMSNEGQTRFDLLINEGLLGKSKKLESSSYKSGYEIVKHNYKDKYDALGEWKSLRKEKDRGLQRKKLLEILRYIKKYPQVFCYKDIAYNKIQYIWNGLAFLYAQNSKKDMIQCYCDTFMHPLREYLEGDAKNRKDQCIQCGAAIKRGGAMGLSWLQMGVDHKRKKSYFWNFIPDSFLCPVCALVYSCAPLGFVFAAGKNDAVFINNNVSINDLRRDNGGETSIILGKKQTVGEVTAALMQKMLTFKERELDNIQVIIRHNDKYNIGIISKDKIEVLKHCEKSFAGLAKIYFKTRNEGYISVYYEVLHNLLHNINNYSLMDKVLREEEKPWYLVHVLRIQIYSKGGGKMSIKYSEARRICDCGLDLRAKIGNGKKESETDNKVRGIVYQLLNALKVKDVNRFMDVICRVYTGLSEKIPSIFLQMFDSWDEDRFRNLGYAFVLGLKGQNEGKKEQEQDIMKTNNSEDLSPEIQGGER